MTQLAIVIPAYKANYLDEALKSISNQTCKDFHLYIGNDCSPYNLEEIVERYKNKFNYTYKRFDNNLGSKDLVAQWERCIDMVQNEEWIWLFSDDDIMGESCVEEFYKQQPQHNSCDLFHFNVQVIDNNSTPITALPITNFPEELNALEFYKQRVSGKVRSFVVEFIFRKETYLAVGKFQNFDLAWSSDVATCVKLCSENDMVTINNTTVFWRKGLENISTNNEGKFPWRKMHAVTSFLLWAEEYFSDNKNINIRKFNQRIFYNRFARYNRYLLKNQKAEIFKLYSQKQKTKKYRITWNKLKLHAFIACKQIIGKERI